MAQYEEEVSRMKHLMEFKMPKGSCLSSNNIEFHKEGADGKVYGILKEGQKYYIKSTEKGKENISESYHYINGDLYKRECEYGSYNDASKHLELKLMSLNEAAGKHEDVSTVDFNRNSKAFATLTEAARTELNRVKQIMENCEKCGKPVMYGDRNGKADDCVYTEKAQPDGDDNNVKVAEESDPKKGDKSVFTEEPKEGNTQSTETLKEEAEGEDIVGIGDNEDVEQLDECGDDLETLIQEMEDALDDISDDEAFVGPHGNGESIAMENPPSEAGEKTVNEEEEYPMEIEVTMGEEPYKAPQKSWNKMGDKSLNESRINRIVEGVCNKMLGKQKKRESLDEAIQRMVNEELTQLNVWGQHPRYQKEPMTTPPNKEVLAGTADRDWNDDSAKGNQPYGRKIGDGKPFNQLVKMVSQEAVVQLKEALKKKK